MSDLFVTARMRAPRSIGGKPAREMEAVYRRLCDACISRHQQEGKSLTDARLAVMVVEVGSDGLLVALCGECSEQEITIGQH